MDDRRKTCLAGVFFISTFVMPLIALAAGWIGWDFKTGVIAALIAFGVFFVLTGVMLVLVRVPSWFTVSLPFTFGMLYSVLPDFIPGPFDDAAAVSAGALFSYVVWLRKQADVPRWTILVLLSAGLYTLVGGLIPGPIDELIVYGITSAITIYAGMRRPEEDVAGELQGDKSLPLDDDETIIDGEFYTAEESLDDEFDEPRFSDNGAA